MWLIVCFFSQWWCPSSVSLWRCLGSKSACRNGPDVFRHNFQFGAGGWLKTDPRGSLASCTRWCKNIRTYPRSLVCFVHISCMWTDVNFRMAKGFYVKSARLAAVSFGPSPEPNSLPLFCDGRQIWCQVPNSAVLKNVIDNDKTDCSIRGIFKSCISTPSRHTLSPHSFKRAVSLVLIFPISPGRVPLSLARVHLLATRSVQWKSERQSTLSQAVQHWQSKPDDVDVKTVS